MSHRFQPSPLLLAALLNCTSQEAPSATEVAATAPVASIVTSVAAPAPSSNTRPPAPQPSPSPATPPPLAPCPKPVRGRVSLMHHVQAGDAKRVRAILDQYRCRFPKRSRLVELGRTHLDLPIQALVIGDDVRPDHQKPTMLLNGAHHGAELMSTLFVLDAIGILLEDDSPATKRILSELVVVAVPLVNPDGNHLTVHKRLVGRKNGRDLDGDGRRSLAEGVDLNRNYPFRWGALGDKGSSPHGISQYYRGPSAGSEPETRAMMRLANSEHFAASISYHTGTVAILSPYTIDGVTNPSPDVARRVAFEISSGIKTHPEGGLPVRRKLYPVDGTDQDWLFATHGTLALLVEGVDNGGRSQNVRRLIVKAVRRSWQILFARFLDGPVLSGRITDSRGRPVDAVVSLDEVKTHENERWRSRCRDGRFDRFVMENGRYTVRVKVAGHDDVVASHVVRGRTDVDIQLPFEIPPKPCTPKSAPKEDRPKAATPTPSASSAPTR